MHSYELQQSPGFAGVAYGIQCYNNHQPKEKSIMFNATDYLHSSIQMKQVVEQGGHTGLDQLDLISFTLRPRGGR